MSCILQCLFSGKRLGLEVVELALRVAAQPTAGLIVLLALDAPVLRLHWEARPGLVRIGVCQSKCVHGSPRNLALV